MAKLLLLRRNNPFAQIETINTGLADTMNPEFFEPFKKILERIKNGEKIDYIRCYLLFDM